MISMKMEFYLPKHVGNNSVSKLKAIVFSGVQRWCLMLIRFVQCVVCVNMQYCVRVGRKS
jgi:hypothetical protein